MTSENPNGPGEVIRPKLSDSLGRTHRVVADFDVRGFKTNLQRLPCSR